MVAAFPLRLSTEVAVHLLFGVVADRAGVVEHKIGIEFGRRFPVAHRFEDSRHPFGIRLVHLAAEGGDPVAPLGLGGGVSGEGAEVTKTRARFQCESLRGQVIFDDPYAIRQARLRRLSQANCPASAW